MRQIERQLESELLLLKIDAYQSDPFILWSIREKLVLYSLACKREEIAQGSKTEVNGILAVSDHIREGMSEKRSYEVMELLEREEPNKEMDVKKGLLQRGKNCILSLVGNEY